MAIQDNVNRLLGSVLGGVTSAKFITNQEKGQRADSLSKQVAVKQANRELETKKAEGEKIAIEASEHIDKLKTEGAKDVHEALVKNLLAYKQAGVDMKYWENKDINKYNIAKETRKEYDQLTKKSVNDLLDRYKELNPQRRRYFDKVKQEYLTSLNSLNENKILTEFLAGNQSKKAFIEAQNALKENITNNEYLNDIDMEIEHEKTKLEELKERWK